MKNRFLASVDCCYLDGIAKCLFFASEHHFHYFDKQIVREDLSFCSKNLPLFSDRTRVN
jgi:hypothetical protein